MKRQTKRLGLIVVESLSSHVTRIYVSRDQHEAENDEGFKIKAYQTNWFYPKYDNKKDL